MSHDSRAVLPHPDRILYTFSALVAHNCDNVTSQLSSQPCLQGNPCCRYRIRLKQRDKEAQKQLQDLAAQLQNLQLDNRQLAARQRLMTDMVESQEFHINVLTNFQASVTSRAPFMLQLSQDQKVEQAIMIHVRLETLRQDCEARVPVHDGNDDDLSICLRLTMLYSLSLCHSAEGLVACAFVWACVHMHASECAPE